MLRRPATTITLTSADLEAYEANRQRKMWEKQQQQQAHEAQAFFAQSTNGSGKQREQAGVRPQQRSQKDRIMGGQTTRHGN
ncbi:hypothetical protein BU23DRAFT_530567 [Bimuria novae-zelandiae CBS 107.79]|uniref:Anaphase-promoting complex, subunit CDC26 n=1 Tax=Bimuria novae-zelandiae CBS 107.79 TaxID=1447943 RepID=A0A6A5VK35_9PLEO|nr:hypothetical protein BU23DRAFT_530567 [Bimuria novae-zelandiae CBS 107.79]